MNIVFMGSADFGIPALQMLRDCGHAICGVVTTPPKAQGRGLHVKQSAVHDYALQQGLTPVFTPERLSDSAFIEDLKKCRADLFVVVAFKILPAEVFMLPPLGTVNIHASLLPRYRGPAPIHRAIQNGETTTGVTVFRIDRGIDTGSIIMQRACAIGPDETTPELYGRLQELGAEALRNALPLLSNPSIPLQKQDDTLACKAPKLKKEEGNINWQLPALTIFNTIRAFKPFPGTYTFIKGQRLNIEGADVRADQSALRGNPGEIIAIDHDSLTVQCGDGLLRITRVKPEGKKSMDVASYLRGTPLTIGSILTTGI